ncbi:MAG TPA: ferrous iron transport protein B [Humisphaera sp.]|nr:ferrous iron transport protein B [Humisphaera sp.]
MPSCCETSTDIASPDIASATGTLTIALAGNPNSGKTTLFNALTGLRQKVANYPGVTVEKKTGRCKLPDGRWADVIDLPGTYSLVSRSPDEQVAMEVLRGLRKDSPAPDIVVVVVDASNLQRNLYLVSQLIELGRPLVVALNMIDIAQRRGFNVSAEKLQAEIGVPVIPVVGYKRKGIAELKAAILQATIAPIPDWPLPPAMREELVVVSGALGILSSKDAGNGGNTRMEDRGWRIARSEIGDDTTLAAPSSILDPPSSNSPAAPSSILPPRSSSSIPASARYPALAERLLIGDRAGDLLDIANHEPVASLLNSATARLHALGIEPMQADVEAHYLWIEGVANRVTTHHDSADSNVLQYAPRKTLTDRVDAIFVHKVWGLLIFAAIMSVLFITLFWLAKPMMDAIQSGIASLGVFTTHRLPQGPIKDLLKDGVFAGVGTVVVFVPQIALLFLFLAILEDTGYLARAAFLMDRLLAKVGLHGKSFIPLLSSFACAIPGIMATRTIENRRERLATILVAPFMSCSARLPVYTLLIGAFFARYGAVKQAGIMLACYALGILAAAGTAWVFKRTLTKGPATSFILELPSYKLPQVSQVARQVLINTKAFLTKAGTTIFCLSVILWAMAYYPRLPAERAAVVSKPFDEQAAILQPSEPVAGADRAPTPTVWAVPDDHIDRVPIADVLKELEGHKEHALAAAQSEYSLSGRLGHLMEPAIRPLGYDWKIGIGLVSAFAAREVFVSSMGIVYSVGEVEEGKTADLSTAMQNDRYAGGPRAGQPVWTPLVAISLLVWFVLAMQCMSTFAIVKRETGGWRWPIFMLVYMNALAYVVALAVYQIGTRLAA